MPLKKLLGAALIAGVIAAFAAAAFHWIFTEPLIDRAIAIEAQSAAHDEAPVVSRPVQKAGLFAGFLLYGLAWGALFGVLLYAVGAKFAPGVKSFFLALMLGWSVALFPLLKYPANPPGVGEAATIGYRQELFLLAIALSLIGTVGALLARERLHGAGRGAAVVIAIVYVVYLVVVYAALPENPDPVKIDTDLVRNFRLLSFAGQALFWAALGGAFAYLARGKDARV